MQEKMSFLQNIHQKLTYLFLLLSLGIGRVCIEFLKIIAPLIPGKPQKDFLFFPYTHKDNSGTISRFQEYFPFLDKDGYTYDIHYVCDMDHYNWIYYAPRKNNSREYMFFHQVFWSRLKWVLKAKNYRAVFFQRALFPDYYEQKSAMLEKLLHKLNNNVTVDYFDADYVRNDTYIMNIIKSCNKISVVNEDLFIYFSQFHSRILYNDLSIDIKRYKAKTDFSIHNPVRIYWTGSIGNAVNLQVILPVLEKINKTIPLVLVMICRTKAGFTQSFIEHHVWEEKTYIDYMIGSDLAIYPVLEDDEYSRGKVAYKALEYAVAKVPMVASEPGLSSRFEKGKDVLIANTKEEWESQLIKAIGDAALRKELAEGAYQKIIKYHDVKVTYKNFIEILKA
jgi:glycosyltransferase involved in cell wall biosynthesis